MKKIAIVLILIIFFGLCPHASATGEQEHGYADGYNDGLTTGQNQGISDHSIYGNSPIYTAAPDVNCPSHLPREYRSGYRTGFREGYYQNYMKNRF